MNTTEVIELIKDFADKDGHRPTIATPWLDRGLIKASEGHVLIMVPEALCPGHGIEGRSTAPDTDKLNLFEDRSYILFDTAVLKPTLAAKADEADPIERACPSCLGTKTIICPTCDEGEIDCDRCSGTGKVEYNRQGKLLRSHLHPVDLFGRHLNYRYLKLLDRAVDLFGGSWKISLGTPSEGKADSDTSALFINDAGVVVAIQEMRQ